MAKPIGWKPMTSQEKQEIVQRYAAGETFEELSRAYGRGAPTIRKLLREAGVPSRRRGYATGTQWHDEWRAAHKTACTTPEFAEKSRQGLLERLPRMRGPATNTAIEQRLQGALIAAGIGFTAQSLLLSRYLVDVEVSQARIVIEADGSQHQLRDRKAADAARDAELRAAGYRVFRFTGSQINRDAAECVRRIVDECGLVPDEVPVYDIRTRFAGELHPRWKGGKAAFVCEACGTTFLAQPAHRSGAHIYCSRQCAGMARRGVPLPAEHRANIGAAGIGRKRGPAPPVTAETRARLSAALKAYHQNKKESALRGDAQRPAEMTGPAA